MTKQQFKYTLGNLTKSIKKLIDQGKEISYSAIFTIDGKKQKLIDLAEYKNFRLVNRFLEDKNPSKIRIELYDRQDTTNMFDFKDYTFEVAEVVPERPAFMGFGEAEINQIVDQRMAEKQRATEHEELKTLATELSTENEELQERIEELEEEKANLEAELEKKQSMRYYAGMLGDILESFGIKRDKIKKPLAELMGVEEEKPVKQMEAPRDDKSGIVEEELSAEDKKRTEIIDLIQQYLKSIPLLTLAKVFQVFSAIEQSPFVADELLDYLNNRNPQTNE